MLGLQLLLIVLVSCRFTTEGCTEEPGIRKMTEIVEKAKREQGNTEVAGNFELQQGLRSCLCSDKATLNGLNGFDFGMSVSSIRQRGPTETTCYISYKIRFAGVNFAFNKVEEKGPRLPRRELPKDTKSAICSHPSVSSKRTFLNCAVDLIPKEFNLWIKYKKHDGGEVEVIDCGLNENKRIDSLDVYDNKSGPNCQQLTYTVLTQFVTSYRDLYSRKFDYVVRKMFEKATEGVCKLA